MVDTVDNVHFVLTSYEFFSNSYVVLLRAALLSTEDMNAVTKEDYGSVR